jgi:hypothetical protein
VAPKTLANCDRLVVERLKAYLQVPEGPTSVEVPSIHQKTNSDENAYHANIKINFTFLGDGEVSKEKRIIINLDKTDHGNIISTRFLTTKSGSVDFLGIPVNVPYVYLDLGYDRDASGWHSDGDSFSFYKDQHGNPIAIDISKGETTLDITLVRLFEVY